MGSPAPRSGRPLPPSAAAAEHGDEARRKPGETAEPPRRVDQTELKKRLVPSSGRKDYSGAGGETARSLSPRCPASPPRHITAGPPRGARGRRARRLWRRPAGAWGGGSGWQCSRPQGTGAASTASSPTRGGRASSPHGSGGRSSRRGSSMGCPPKPTPTTGRRWGRRRALGRSPSHRRLNQLAAKLEPGLPRQGRPPRALGTSGASPSEPCHHRCCCCRPR